MLSEEKEENKYISPIYSPSFYFLLTGFTEPNPVIYSTILCGTVFQVVFILPSTCTHCLHLYAIFFKESDKSLLCEKLPPFALSEPGLLKLHCMV